jgi:hypothetical protein
MKMNLENLLHMVLEHFGNTESYHKIRLECWEKLYGDMRKYGATPKNHSLYPEHLESKDAYNFSRAYAKSDYVENAIWDFCNILGIDKQKLYKMARAFKKWHDDREWLVSFPFTDKNTEAILGYIQA